MYNLLMFNKLQNEKINFFSVNKMAMDELKSKLINPALK